MGIAFGSNGSAKERTYRIAQRFGIDIQGWILDEACGEYWSMMANPETNTILLCSPWMKGETDETIAFFIAHEISHKKTRDEAQATLYAIEILKDKMPKKLKAIVGLWYNDYMNRTPAEKALYPAQHKYLEMIREYIIQSN